MTRSRRFAVVWVANAVVAFAGCRAKDGAKDLPSPEGSSPPPVPSLAASAGGAADAGPAVVLVASGTTRALKQAELSASAAGTLQSIEVGEGDAVKKGQVLFRVDAADAGIAIQRAQADLSSAKVTLAGAELEYRRTKQLAADGSVAPATLDNAKLSYDKAQAGVDQAQVALSAAQKSAADTVVKSPIDGVVAQKLKEAGESVTANGPPILVVQDISKLEIRVELPETELARVRPGDPLRVTIRAASKSFDLTVERINPSVDHLTRTIEVVALLDNESGAIKAGLLVEAEFPATDT